MKTHLIVNPLATVDVMDENGDLISGGPVPGRGMKYLQISADTQPNLYSLFQDLSNIGLTNLDIGHDLREGEAELLSEHGILIDADNVPERPLFACMLNDVENSVTLPHSLIVNPTLEFLPFDLTKFRSWIHDKHLSPQLATAWVTDPETEMRWGYWLDQKQADQIGRFKPGEAPTDGIDEMTLAKLLSATILMPGKGGAELDHYADKAREFVKKRYTVIDDVIPPAQLRALRSYYRQYVEQGFMRFGDEFVSRRFSEHGEHVAYMVLINLIPLMAKIAGLPVQPTYSHSAVYDEGAELDPHLDREACEFSFSFQLDYLPEPENGISPWPLYLSSRSPNEWSVSPETDNAIHLSNGSCLAYKGRELVHYRMPLPEGHRSTSLFFHYVPA